MAATTKLRIQRRRRRTRRRRNPFLDGIAGIFDFTGSLRTTHTRSRIPPQTADRDALRSDWIAVGNDFRVVMGDWERPRRPVEDKPKRDKAEKRLA